jgi:pimeloyl-ACP methyl ester carboxylesterase
MYSGLRGKPGHVSWRLAAGVAGLLMAAGCASVVPQAAPPPSRSPTAPGCQTVLVPVMVPPQTTAPGQITGDFCQPDKANGIMLLLVAGGGENADYWNMPGLPENSLVTAANRAGYATFAIDRIGTGRSTIPIASSQDTYGAQVATVDQVIAEVRQNPALFGRAWRTVIGIGHSLGSGTLAGVAAQHPGDLDAMVLTGYGAAVTPETLQLDKLYQVPAATISKHWSDLDPGYVTVVPSAVEKIGLLYGPDTSPAALSAASGHQGTLSDTELASRPQGAAAKAQAAKITLPALVADGQYDRHYCEGNAVDAAPTLTPQCGSTGAFDAYEKALLPNACLATKLITNSGHAIQEEEAAPAANSLYLAWLSATLTGGHAHCAVNGPDPANA